MNNENRNSPNYNHNINQLGTARQVQPIEIERMRKRSLEGEAKRIDRQERRMIKQEQYDQRRRVIISTAIAAVIALGSFTASPHIIQKINEWKIENDPIARITDEYTHIISESTIGRTPDGYNPIYDYYQIAQNINESENFDNSLFATYKSLSLRTNIETNTQVTDSQVIEDLDQILRYTDYDTFNNYLAQNGYTNIDDWKQEMIKRIETEDKERSQSATNEEELQEMMEENQSYTDSQGGKSL